MKPKIVYEDKLLMVISKPSGVVVNQAESVVGETVQEWALVKLKTQLAKVNSDTLTDKIFLERSGIAHRLDKDTSGCLLIAKDPETLAYLMKQFKERQVHKTYITLVHGNVEPKEGWWYWPIQRRVREKRDEFGVKAMGKIAQTNYKVIKYIKDLTLLECYPVTGRTHQIRVHASFASYPLVSDQKYGNNKTWKTDLDWCPRHFLHAKSISFSHPILGKKMTVTAELPEDLAKALEYAVSH